MHIDARKHRFDASFTKLHADLLHQDKTTNVFVKVNDIGTPSNVYPACGVSACYFRLLKPNATDSEENVTKHAMKVELVSIHEASKPLCEDSKVLIQAMSADKKFSIENKILKFSGVAEYAYSVNDWFNVDGRIGFFHTFTLETDGEATQEQCDAYSEMLKCFKTNLWTLEAKKIETLWDDISFRYCKLAYPIILKIENKMRKLIAQFMLKTLGERWITQTAPKEVADEIGRSERAADDPLHQVDFATLVAYMTKPYSKSNIDSIYKIIKEADDTDKERAIDSIKKLKDMLPLSNWKRHFSAIVKCNDTELISKWDALYKLRCKVAHNTYLTSVEYESVTKLSDELEQIIENALSEVNSVVVTEEDAQNLKTMANQLTETASFSRGVLSAFEGSQFESSIREIERNKALTNFVSIIKALKNMIQKQGMVIQDNGSIEYIFEIAMKIGCIAGGEVNILQRTLGVLSSESSSNEEIYNAKELMDSMSYQFAKRSQMLAARKARFMEIEKTRTGDREEKRENGEEKGAATNKGSA
ncbi:HEPN domain-containing protein [Burkholderia gladioli]|uniref:HEPN domain-containing protein n=1 Tax=Burkholderia gladioli TaxID=28095 RepID=UPI001640FF25|nr:HEPN domain-containing protein [Burkholderia gladioli]